MSDTPQQPSPSPKPDDKPHKVDEAVQEDAAKERADNDGYN